ncbi:MAG TPA: CAP domain-containing protein [Solirubrobacteraceae bacterium]
MGSARIATSRTAAVLRLCAAALLLSCAIVLLAAQISTAAATSPAISSATPAAHVSAVRARAASSCPNANLTPQPGNLGQIRAAVLCLIDQEREARGESALQPNTKLTRAAQGHSEDMSSEDYFSHTAPNGESPLDRMRGAGYIYSSRIGYEVGENIAWGTLWLASPQSIVNAWMASPGHRANILDAHYRETGIGVSPHPPAAMADGQAGALYTQDFGTIVTTGRAARHVPTQSRHRGSAGRSRALTSPKRPHHRGSARRSRAHHSSKHRSSGRSRRITSGARTPERSHKNHGSTRRQVRHRHRVRARHRSRHRRTAHRARRAGAHQRSRRRHRQAGR